jgi:hypothetical protein
MAQRFVVSGLDSRGRAVSTEVIAENLTSARDAAERRGLTFVVAYPAFPSPARPPGRQSDPGKEPPPRPPGRGAQRR